MYQYRRRKMIIAAGTALACLVLFAALISRLVPDGEKKAEEAVRKFYQYEQKGNFSESWDMFHPLMQERFSKGHYIQDRAHVFLNHFGVDTFDVVLGDAEKMDRWKMTGEAEPLEDVYKVPVTMVYKGKYGNFNIQQDVFAVKEEGEWKILWDYKK